MEHWLKSIALAVLLSTSASTAEATAWRVEGFFRFELYPTYADTGQPLGFFGDSVLYYSATITTKDFTNETVDDYLQQFFLQNGVWGMDSVNGGPWTPIIGTPLVFLHMPYDPDEPIPPDPHPDFLMPNGGYTFDAYGQFAWWRNSDAQSADFEYNGVSWHCDSDGLEGCLGFPNGVETWLNFDRASYGEGTVERIAEPTSVALLSLGLAGLGLSRRRKA